VRGRLLRLGRWLRGAHPEAADPATWTRELCAEAVAAVDRMRVGEYAQRHDCLGDRVGRPLSASAKQNYLTTLRQFFRDLQEWGWIPVRFTPARTFATPRSVRAVLGPDPRVLADDLWAKLLWAGLHLEESDLAPLHDGGTFYPLAFVRALAVTWLFGGLRSDEIVRLRVGCVRWQPAEPLGMTADGATAAAAAAAAPSPVCLLDVPVHKTGTAFTKPVDAVVGQTIAAWEAARPARPLLPDGKTGESVAFLFCYRARRLRTQYLNLRLIPLLCRKAGLPLEDARGRITSHRARATIATQLYNAKEPMTLVELQAWLGHRTPRATQHYAQLTPTTLAKAYTDAGYFARNVRTIEVLLDRDAVQTGAAGTGTPWQYFDLGHGFCTYSFFEQCPHRLACARCDFYLPKASTRAQLLEARANLQRLRLAIPLTEGERAAVEDGTAAVEHLLERLADTPTPAGPTPRELQATFTTFIPRDAVAKPPRRT
jgi:integrase